jgi:membrane protein YdbS with pleckstrin-like domain
MTKPSRYPPRTRIVVLAVAVFVFLTLYVSTSNIWSLAAAGVFAIGTVIAVVDIRRRRTGLP